MLPTNEKVAGVLCKISNILTYQKGLVTNGGHIQAQHLYILSDEEIKEGDWVYENNLNQETKIYQILKREDRLMFFRFRSVPIWLDKDQHGCKKIIATTDYLILKTSKSINKKQFPDIIVPQIPQSFIEYFVEQYNKGNIITKVMVEYEEILGDEGIIKVAFGETDFKLKIKPDNTINIKPIKDSWSRDEVKHLLECAWNGGAFWGSSKPNSHYFEKWIEENI